jgi:ribosomal protein L15E
MYYAYVDTRESGCARILLVHKAQQGVVVARVRVLWLALPACC